MQRGSVDNFIDDIFDSLPDPEENSLELARQAIEKHPEDGLILRLAAFAALKKNLRGNCPCYDRKNRPGPKHFK